MPSFFVDDTNLTLTSKDLILLKNRVHKDLKSLNAGFLYYKLSYNFLKFFSHQ